MSAASAGAGCLGTGPLATDEGLENGAAINLALPEGFHGEGDAAIGLLERGRDHRRVELYGHAIPHQNTDAAAHTHSKLPPPKHTHTYTHESTHTHTHTQQTHALVRSDTGRS